MQLRHVAKVVVAVDPYTFKTFGTAFPVVAAPGKPKPEPEPEPEPELTKTPDLGNEKAVRILKHIDQWTGRITLFRADQSNL